MSGMGLARPAKLLKSIKCLDTSPANHISEIFMMQSDIVLLSMMV